MIGNIDLRRIGVVISCKYRKKKLTITAVMLLALFLCTGCAGERKEQQAKLRENGIQLMQQGEYEEALEVFQEGLDLSLGQIGEIEKDICYYKAETFYKLGDTQSAMDIYTAMIHYNQDAKAYFLRGSLYYTLGDEINAQKDYTAAIETEKNDYALYIGIYEALVSYGKEKEAQTYLNQALELKADTPYDKMQKGRINYLLGETKMAVSLLEEAAKGKEMEAYCYLAEIQYETGDTAAAEANLAVYMKSGIADAYQLFSVANKQLEKGNYDMALECLHTALALENVPNKQILLKTLVIAYEKKLDFAAAKQVMEEYVQNYPEDEEAFREYTFLETR